MLRGGVKKKEKHEVSGRGPIRRCVEKFFPVPRGGVKRKKKSVGHHLCNDFSFRSVP